MRLTHIKLAGFKSFVDPTTLLLSSNLTSVVGPNGCGKSNVIDAVRWVTGESSARQLRGEALEDVIFNGSKARKPVGRASVELKFDNGEGKLGGQYAAFSEISVKRELSRDSGSKYSINGTRARRRDVVDLFLGTGLGGRSNYAVIEQGAVNRLIEARPEDIRQVLEEAAGISKYKERRRETEHRIRHTRENLDRLNDLVGELGQRLATLKRQATSAEKYKAYKADERALRAELLALRWRSRSAEVDQAAASVEAAQDSLRDAVSARRQAQQMRDCEAAGQQQFMSEVQAQQAAYYDAQAAVGRIEQALAHAREVEALRQRERHTLTERLGALDKRLADDRDIDSALAGEQDKAEQQRSVAADTLQQARATRGVTENEASIAERCWDDLNNAEHNPVHQLDAERRRARYAVEQRDKLSQRDAARRAERKRLPTVDAAALARREQDLTALEQRLASDQTAAIAASRSDDALIGEISKLERNLQAQRTALGEQQAELASERKMQQAVLREDDQTIGRWLAAQGQQQPTGVARRVKVRREWQTAAETALGSLLGGFLLESLDAPLTGEWPGESVALVEADRQPARQSHARDRAGPPGLECLANGLEGPAGICAAAARVFVADDVTAGLAARRALDAHQEIVTLDGCRIGPSSLITPAAQSAEKGVFEREQRIADFEQRVLASQDAVEQCQIALDSTRTRQTEARAARAALDRRIGEQRREAETVRAQLQGERLRLEQARQRTAEIESELAELAEQYQAALVEAEQAEYQVGELEQQASDFSAARRAAQTRMADARSARDRARSEAVKIERGLRELEAALSKLATQRESLVVRLADNRTAREDVLQRLARFDADQTGDSGHDYSEDELAAAREARHTAERTLRAAREALQAREKTLQQCAQAMLMADQDVDRAREELQKTQIAVETADVRRQGVAEQLAELGEAPEAVAQRLAEDATVDAWADRLETIERRIQRLGAINLAAIEEYEEEAVREKYLAEQHADLVAALETLENAIAKIDRETRQRFKTTFEQVNLRFSEMFPQLFGGGEAALELTEDDWLSTGVRVMARPPGKRNASIQMLSGGEKALTAVALLFALFELNPAPFCMLDEIDAPLDDANVSRFCELVRRMSAQVQFIVITHNKLTMELAEQLHGVTMAEPGVSRLVSVDIDQALDMAG
ncbi:MAG: chromosome segregation protein SMC [Salinisphaera sp.]|jgi:chromosome segregation protein|nr:chromosome segregation protein SMC [Salinisphaera sp.]